MLVERQDFNDAMKRQLIRLYDYKRSENYSFDNCKHLACTEVRAALFHSQCNPSERSKASRLRMTGNSKEKMDANEFCVKEKAIEYLQERSKCSAKADRYINYVFEKCKKDTAPFSGSSRNRSAKTFTTIM